jgi:hypothetical protein
MPAKAVARTGAPRRGRKRKTIAVDDEPTQSGLGAAERDPDDWIENEPEGERLDESQVEMLLTGHAATHGAEGEDNWLIETEESSWNER